MRTTPSLESARSHRATVRLPLSDLTQAVDTYDPGSLDPATQFVYIDIASIDRDSKAITTVSHLQAADAPSRARQLVTGGDVLVSTVRPNLNAVARVPQTLHGAVASTGFCVLRPDAARLDSGYLYHWVRSPGFVAQMALRATGASYPAVTDAIVKDSRLPVLPVPEQRRIAAVLDKADAIRRKRREAIRLADDLLRSAFLDMFGDPVTNPKGWPLQRLDEVAAVNRGKFTPRPRNDPRYYGGPFPFIQTGDLSGCTGVLRTWHQSLNEAGTEVSRRFPRGTIAIAIAANIGDTVILDFDSYFPDSVVGIEVNTDNATAEYVETCLRFFQGLLKDAAPKTAQKNINLEVLRPLRVPAPPVESQQRFSDLFRGHVKYVATLAVAHTQTDHLFDALVQSAFQGGPRG